MSTFRRWVRFNAVGVMGVAVQLGTLAALVHLWPGHYMVCAAGALELTLLHNWMWHESFTWRARRLRGGKADRLLRFHLTNGAVSMCGNLLLMRLLVGAAHLPSVTANAIAIAVCSLVNFALSDRWAFREDCTVRAHAVGTAG